MTVGMARIEAVLIGRAAPFIRPGVVSGIAKRPVAAPVALGPTGLAGDEQGDRRHHGGIEKAVHHYALDHYAAWRRELPGPPAVLDAPGAFGENLATLGLTEAAICVGDVWRAGSALLEVSQARQPCWKLNHRFGMPDMARRVQASGRTGWYYRVIEPGEIHAGACMRLLARPHPDWTLARLVRVLYVDRLDRAPLEAIASLGALASSWRSLAAKRLERGSVEDWAARLDGPG